MSYDPMLVLFFSKMVLSDFSQNLTLKKKCFFLKILLACSYSVNILETFKYERSALGKETVRSPIELNNTIKVPINVQCKFV